MQVLHEQTQRFIDQPAYVPVVDEDPQTGEHVLKVQVREWPPVLDWAVVAGDAIHNLRSGLEHLAFILCGDPPPNPNKSGFPIFDTEQGFEDKGAALIDGAGAEVAAIIKAIQPGVRTSTTKAAHRDPLWSLYQLSNTEKHQLVLTVGGATHGANFPIRPNNLERTMREVITIGAAALRQVITEQDQELVRWTPDTDLPKLDPQSDFNLAFLIAFDPEGPGRGRPVHAELRRIDHHIRHDVLWPLCPHLPGTTVSENDLMLAIAQIG